MHFFLFRLVYVSYQSRLGKQNASGKRTGEYTVSGSAFVQGRLCLAQHNSGITPFLRAIARKRRVRRALFEIIGHLHQHPLPAARTIRAHGDHKHQQEDGTKLHRSTPSGQI